MTKSTTPVKAKAKPVKALKLNPVAKWGVAPKDSTVNGKIIAAVKNKATSVEKLVAYFAKSGLAPKSVEYQTNPKSYITGYIAYLRKHSVIA